MGTMTADLGALKAYFDQHRQEWLRAGREGQWALIGEDRRTSFHPTYAAAVQEAARVYGPKTCLIQEVLEEDRTESIQHVFWTEPWAETRS